MRDRRGCRTARDRQPRGPAERRRLGRCRGAPTRRTRGSREYSARTRPAPARSSTGDPRAWLYPVSEWWTFRARRRRPKRSLPQSALRAEKSCQFSGNARPRPQVVITRIAVRHEHHLAPRLLSRDPVVVKEEPDDDHQPPPSTSNLPRTTSGKTKSRRISQGRCRRFGDPTSTGCTPKGRDGGIGERRGEKAMRRRRA